MAHMKLRYRIKEAFKFLSFAFYPKTTLIACIVFTGIVIAALVFTMLTIPQESNWYNVVFALTTGAVGSSIVSFVVELTSNYKHNKLAFYELRKYYSAIENYEIMKQIKMQNTSVVQRAKKKAHEEFQTALGVDEVDEDKPKDIIQITWEELPELIPVLKSTINEKKEFLSDKEIHVIEGILSDYMGIEFAIGNCVLLSPMSYDAINHPDEDYLRTLYPSNILKRMPDWIREDLARKESRKARDSYVDTILSDSFLFSQVMKDYEVSLNALRKLDERKDLKELDEMEECEYLEEDEPEDEETFRAGIEACYRYVEEESRASVSCFMSMSCWNISARIDELERIILKKPFYGTKLEIDRSFAKESIGNSIVSKTIYERERNRLEKLIAKKKADSSI